MPFPVQSPRCAACRIGAARPGDALCRACAAELAQAIALLEVAR